MTGVVPKVDRGLLRAVFIAQAAQASRTEHERSAEQRFQPNPTRSQYSKKVAAREKQNVSGNFTDALHDTVCPRRNVFWRFAARAAIAEQLPVRAFCKDLSRAAAFVLSIVPLDQVTVSFSLGFEPSKFTRPHGPTQGTGKYHLKCHPVQPLAKLSGIALPAFGEWEIGEAGVLTGDCP